MTGCARSDKTKYPNRKAAAQRASFWRKTLREPIYAYHCARCHCWHIGHTPGWKKASWTASPSWPPSTAGAPSGSSESLAF